MSAGQSLPPIAEAMVSATLDEPQLEAPTESMTPSNEAAAGQSMPPIAEAMVSATFSEAPTQSMPPINEAAAMPDVPTDTMPDAPHGTMPYFLPDTMTPETEPSVEVFSGLLFY